MNHYQAVSRGGRSRLPFISFHFGVVGLYFLSFLPFGGQLLGPPNKLPRTIRFPNVPYKEFSSARPGSIFQFLSFCAFISFYFGLVGLHFLVFWPCGHSFPFILAFWAFISFHFGLVGIHCLSFWPCRPSFHFILAFSGSASGVPPKSCEKRSVFPMSHIKNLAAPGPASFSNFSPFCAFISLHFGLVGIHFLSFWPCGHSFPFILALWAFISLYFGLVNLHFFHFGIIGLHFLSFWLVGLHFLSFWPCLVGLHFLSF